MGAEIDSGAFGGVQVVESGYWDDGLVSDSVAVYDQSVGVGLDDISSESRDHGWRFRRKRLRMQEVRHNLLQILG